MCYSISTSLWSLHDDTGDVLRQELEFWTVSCGNTSLRYALYGHGVKQEFTFTPEDGVINMGKAKLEKTAKKQIVVSVT